MSNINRIPIWPHEDATTFTRVMMDFIKFQFSPSLKDDGDLFGCEVRTEMLILFLGIFQQCFDKIFKLFVDLAHFHSPLTAELSGVAAVCLVRLERLVDGLSP